MEASRWTYPRLDNPHKAMRVNRSFNHNCLLLFYLSGPESADKLVVQLASLRVFDSCEGVGLCPLQAIRKAFDRRSFFKTKICVAKSTVRGPFLAGPKSDPAFTNLNGFFINYK